MAPGLLRDGSGPQEIRGVRTALGFRRVSQTGRLCSGRRRLRSHVTVQVASQRASQAPRLGEVDVGDLVGVELPLFHGHGDLLVPRIGEAGQEQKGPQHVFVAGTFRSAGAIDAEPDVALGLERGPQQRRPRRRRHQAGERGLPVSCLLEVEGVENFDGHAVVGVVEREQNLQLLLAGGVLVGLGGHGCGHDHVERSLAGVAVAGEEGMKVFDRLWHLLCPGDPGSCW